MDLQSPPAIIITKTERHDIRAEAIERVARQLCLAEGCEPDDDIRCSPMRGLSNLSTCDLVGMSPPTNRRWYYYRDKAEKLLQEAFEK